jgi:hypothetical protein
MGKPLKSMSRKGQLVELQITGEKAGEPFNAVVKTVSGSGMSFPGSGMSFGLANLESKEIAQMLFNPAFKTYFHQEEGK